jgi:hypothetical protein
VKNVLFLQKKNQKTPVSSGALPLAPPWPNVNKSFLLLFFKKEALSFFLLE